MGRAILRWARQMQVAHPSKRFKVPTWATETIEAILLLPHEKGDRFGGTGAVEAPAGFMASGNCAKVSRKLGNSPSLSFGGTVSC